MRRTDFIPHHPELQIIQDDDMFLINSDTEVLGEFLEVHKHDTVLDMGTNTGGLLLYASLWHPQKMIGIDINEAALSLAEETMALNHIENVELIKANLLEYTGNPVDVVICNPPYFKTEDDNKADNSFKNLAKHEGGGLTLPLLVKAIARNLRDGGTLYFLFLSSRLEEVMKELDANNIAVKEMKFVYDENKENSNVFMIKGMKNGRKGMFVKKPVIITRSK